MYTISVLAREFGLSRSALLYYDRIGLLKPSGRSAKAYRHYSADDRLRLERICLLRAAGLPLERIGAMLERPAATPAEVALATHLHELSLQIQSLRAQQARVVRLMLAGLHRSPGGPIDRESLVAMLHEAGLNDDDLKSLHAQFEHTNPAEHANFLRGLGMSDGEIKGLQSWLAGA